MTFVRSKNISLKYQRFTTLGSKDIGIRKSEFVTKTQFLLIESHKLGWKIINFDRISQIVGKNLKRL